MKNELKYDDFGNFDADYYVEQAYALRRAYYAEIAKNAVANVKAFFASLTIRTMKSA
ncbi:hypothetical protein MUS1_02610 [Marinomonas ushuaiensis DSM 15871]|uniref:Uncharacterized protein n=1 Tax=Marinomonas ushuaiensis DSM 15871 TaxID=1122207 RepID=X7E8V8_9GAMM|nr:hypothetical protein [Marinomonas ushuaiensis]ETX12499.1 hypothetical protein MUS1_02610 [Marinomonas ushuaiensis DSM 15871]